LEAVRRVRLTADILGDNRLTVFFLRNNEEEGQGQLTWGMMMRGITDAKKEEGNKRTTTFCRA